MVQTLSDRVVESMPWLDDAAETVQKTLSPVLGPEGPKPVQDALNGTWLGHPLHPALVSVPLGAWTMTLLFDLLGQEDAADLSLKVGLLGALGAAASGAAQWQDTMEKPRRMGFLHASLNSGAATLYAASWLLRARGARGGGIALSTLGLAIGTFSAWLGGDLAYVLGLGVNRTAFEEAPTTWTEVLDEGEMEEDEPRRVEVNGVPVMLLRREGEIVALSATCSHMGGPLDKGTIDDETVTCPWHGSVFCLHDGSVVHGPATAPQPSYEVETHNGKIAVRAR